MAFSRDASYLSAARRTATFAALQTGTHPQVDVVVIGAGITGAGVALDAQLRGLSVLLVEAEDLAFGTSRWSSKLAHGGLRYLASGNVGIAYRSAVERGILMEVTAPHLTHALAQIIPVLDRFPWSARLLPRLGFLMGDVLRVLAGTSATTLPRSRTIGPAQVRRRFPAVATAGLRAGYVNYDGQIVDDARLVTTIARTAAGYGATVLTHTRVTAATGTRVELRDHTGQTATVSALAVINATGVWVGTLQSAFHVTPSRGTHLVVPSAALGNPTESLTVPVAGSINRYCFVLPKDMGRCYVGLTDEPAPGPIPDVPVVPADDVTWILHHINEGLQRHLTRDDVIGSFAGLRPLLAVDAGPGAPPTDTADLSREHALLTDDTGMITIAGGKLTEYRLMAEQAVDAAVARLARTNIGPCRTATTPLLGARRAAASRGVAAPDLAAIPERIVRYYGWEAPEVVRSARCPRPLDPIAPQLDVTRAEIEYAIRREGALSVSDVLDRRTRIGLVDADRAAAEPGVREIFALLNVVPLD